MNMTSASTNEAPGSAAPSRWPNRLVRRPPSSRIAAPSAGSAMRSQVAEKMPEAAAACWWPSAASRVVTVGVLVLQQVGAVDRGRATGAEDGHDDRQPDHDLRGGDDHHEE